MDYQQFLVSKAAHVVFGHDAAIRLHKPTQHPQVFVNECYKQFININI